MTDNDLFMYQSIVSQQHMDFFNVACTYNIPLGYKVLALASDPSIKRKLREWTG